MVLPFLRTSNWDSLKRKLTFIPLKPSLFTQAEFVMVAFSFFFLSFPHVSVYIRLLYFLPPRAISDC